MIAQFLSTCFPVHACYLKPIQGDIVQPRRMTDPLENHWDSLLESEHGVGVVMPGEYDELRANLATDQMLWRLDLAIAAYAERVRAN